MHALYTKNSKKKLHLTSFHICDFVSLFQREVGGNSQPFAVRQQAVQLHQRKKRAAEEITLATSELHRLKNAIQSQLDSLQDYCNRTTDMALKAYLLNYKDELQQMCPVITDHKGNTIQSDDSASNDGDSSHDEGSLSSSEDES